MGLGRTFYSDKTGILVDWLVINRDGDHFNLSRRHTSKSANRYPEKRPFLILQRGLQALVLSDDKKMRSSTTGVLKVFLVSYVRLSRS